MDILIGKMLLLDFDKSSRCHQEAVEVIISLPAITMNIGTHLSNQYIREKELNRLRYYPALDS